MSKINPNVRNFCIIAHRGVTENGSKDNSLQALKEIKEIKSVYTLGVEFDIQLTIDNKIILFHGIL